ncbi:hypothetical protein M514_02700 [Trichuris suis]|uniref:NAD(+) kinase n=1 Tax=Trichuris suis TaxID=68888 RepID=A0A085MHA0_9BILA|nr:hypothetical protein M513_02700 [Trichuris suis]KFD71123.1 hypothetical protein M514_02700 [Trichuris suis]
MTSSISAATAVAASSIRYLADVSVVGHRVLCVSCRRVVRPTRSSSLSVVIISCRRCLGCLNTVCCPVAPASRCAERHSRKRLLARTRMSISSRRLPSMNSSREHVSDIDSKPYFNPSRVLVLSKITRLDFERRRLQKRDDEDSQDIIRDGADCSKLWKQHNAHYSYLKRICQELSARNIEYKVVQRWDYNPEAIDWCDAVISAGGDGTYLLAASKIREQSKPLIGINTDPTSSEGYLCLMKKRSEEYLPEALNRLFSGDFTWLWRQRIRVTLSGKNAFAEPVELFDQQLMYPEYRWSDHVREYEDVRLRSLVLSRAAQSAARPSSGPSGNFVPSFERLLPYLALNDVFIGESLSSRVSYYDLQVDDGKFTKQKSSGLTVCTGTGSTSWYFNINKLTDMCLKDLLKLVSDEFHVQIPYEDESVVQKICKRFNDKLVFSPEDPSSWRYKRGVISYFVVTTTTMELSGLAYAVRDPVFNATFPPFPARGFSRKMVVQSRGYDAHLVIDGGMSYIFNHGTVAKLEINAQDALRTVIFR